MADPSPSLRARQAELARTAMVETFLEALEAGEDDLPMGELARRAGVSRRTLYRYFPSRDHLLAAAADRLYDPDGGLPIAVESAADIVPSFLAASAISTRRPQLARALLESPEGRRLRADSAARRTAAITRAVEELGDEAHPGAAALICELCSSRAWVNLHFDRGLPIEEARATVAWALETLIAAAAVR